MDVKQPQIRPDVKTNNFGAVAYRKIARWKMCRK